VTPTESPALPAPALAPVASTPAAPSAEPFPRLGAGLPAAPKLKTQLTGSDARTDRLVRDVRQDLERLRLKLDAFEAIPTDMTEVDLETLGYAHRGDLGIPGREAFFAPLGAPAQHLYLCREGSASLRNHLALRDQLRADPETAAAYGTLKGELAAQHPHDIAAYIAGKAEFVLLARAGFSEDELRAIGKQNGIAWPPPGP
jgi:hypothetical protein